METKYVGTRTPDGCRVVKVEDGKDPEPLDLRQELWNHSQEFNWGYGGSGPAQTALAILADATGNDRLAVALHQRMKKEVVAKFPEEGFSLDAAKVQAWATQAGQDLDLSDWVEPDDQADEFDLSDSEMEQADLPDEEEAPFPARAPAPTRERKESLGVRGNRDLVQKLLAVAREFDVEKGGLFDAGSGAVQLWCSPEDKPAGWNAPITPGGFGHARELVGCLSWDWEGEEAVLYVEGYPYELLPSRDREQWDRIPEETWRGVTQWLREKGWELVRLARIHETRLGCGCPFCTFVLPAGQLANALVEHVADQHGDVASVTLGEGLIIEMRDGRRVKARDVTDIQGGASNDG
jgi:hypothetical protein